MNKEREGVSQGLGEPVYYKVNLRKGKMGTLLQDRRAEGTSNFYNMGSGFREGETSPCERFEVG